MPTKIMTVCGPIAPEQLGVTSMHEHIIVDCSMFRRRAGRVCFSHNRSEVKPEDKLLLANRSDLRHNIVLSIDNMRLDDEMVMTEEVRDFKAGGGDTIVEVSAPGIRSSPQDLFAIRRISKATGVNIIASTGLYAEYTWPAHYREMTYDKFTSFLNREITHGIGETGILPGHIKAAYEVPSDPLEAYLRAAAAVSGETGLSLQVHLGSDVKWDDVQANVVKPLSRGGCIPERTVLCHVQFLMGDLFIDTLVMNPGHVPFDITPHQRLLEMGFVLSFTPLGFEADNEPLGIAHYPDWYTMAGLAALVKKGYSGQLVIGNDVFTKLATRRGGGDGYRRMLDFIIPALKNCSVSDSDIHKITVENPARILAY